MSDLRYPVPYQINIRVWLNGLSRALGRRATLDDIRDGELDRLAALGFDWVWLLSVWQTGPAAQAISRTHAGWRREFAERLPDSTDDDIDGSGFATRGYAVHRDLGGAEALARLRIMPTLSFWHCPRYGQNLQPASNIGRFFSERCRLSQRSE